MYVFGQQGSREASASLYATKIKKKRETNEPSPWQQIAQFIKSLGIVRIRFDCAYVTREKMQMKVMNGKLASIQQCAGLLSFNLGGTGTGSEKPQLSRHFENLNGKFASHGNRRWRD